MIFKDEQIVLKLNTTDKLVRIFFEKFVSVVDGQNKYHYEDIWTEYLRTLPEVRYIKKFSDLGEPIDYLLGMINESPEPFNNFVIRDLGMLEYTQQRNFIVLGREFAMKVLTLGGLP